MLVLDLCSRYTGSTTVMDVVRRVISTPRISSFHRKVEVGPTLFFMQLFIDKAGRHTQKKLGGQFLIATFCSDKGGP